MQKKRVAALFLVLSVVMAMVASAAPRYNVTASCEPGLLVKNGTAYCDLTVDADTGAKIKGTLTLYYGSAKKAVWNVSGTTYLDYSAEYDVSGKGTYELVADLTVTASGGSDDLYESVTYNYK